MAVSTHWRPLRSSGRYGPSRIGAVTACEAIANAGHRERASRRRRDGGPSRLSLAGLGRDWSGWWESNPHRPATKSLTQKLFLVRPRVACDVRMKRQSPRKAQVYSSTRTLGSRPESTPLWFLHAAGSRREERKSWLRCGAADSGDTSFAGRPTACVFATRTSQRKTTAEEALREVERQLPGSLVVRPATWHPSRRFWHGGRAPNGPCVSRASSRAVDSCVDSARSHRKRCRPRLCKVSPQSWDRAHLLRSRAGCSERPLWLVTIRSCSGSYSPAWSCGTLGRPCESSRAFCSRSTPTASATERSRSIDQGDSQPRY